MSRGSGRTTRQMLDAPDNSVFVWVNGNLDYPRYLAIEIGRMDLRIVSPMWLEREQNFLGSKLSGIVIDHAALLNDRQYRGFSIASDRCARNAG